MAVAMYNAKVGSPTTVITANLTAGTTTIPVQDIAALTTAPGLATLLDGTGNQEVILYTGITGNDLTGVTRGFEGAARTWATGTFISRRLTAHDVNSLQDNVNTKVSKNGDSITGLLSISRTDTSMQIQLQRTGVNSGMVSLGASTGNVVSFLDNTLQERIQLDLPNRSIFFTSSLGARITAGIVSPEGNVTANRGSIYLREQAETTNLYVKQSGTGNTGWVVK